MQCKAPVCIFFKYSIAYQEGQWFLFNSVCFYFNIQILSKNQRRSFYIQIQGK